MIQRYDIYSEDLEDQELQEIVEDVFHSDPDLRNRGLYSDFSHFIEPNGSGFDMVRLIETGQNYTTIYFHIDEQVKKEGEIGWEEVEEKLSYDPRKLV